MDWWICDNHLESVKELTDILAADGQKVSKVFNSPEQAIENLQSITRDEVPQGIFLDIDFQEKGEGLETAEQIRKIAPNLPIIFITADPDKYSQMLLLKFEHPFGYLINPFDNEIVRLYIRKMEDRKKSEACLTIQFKRKDYHIRLTSIVFLESDRHVTRIVTENGEYRTYERLSELFKRLNPDFVQCHKSFIVNLKFIECFEGDSILLKNGQQIPVSRSARKNVREAFLNCLNITS